MSEDFLITTLLEEFKPFIKRTLYTLVKASMDTQLSLSEAAAQMGVNRSTLKKRCQRGTFPHKVVDRVYYISKIDMNLYIGEGPEELAKYSKEFYEQLKNSKKNDKS